MDTIDCETGGTFDPNIHSRSGKYHGLAQADSAFSRRYAGVDDAHTLSVEGQVAMMANGYKERGASPWPHCGR